MKSSARNKSRASTACDNCREKKTKCHSAGEPDTCYACARKGLECRWTGLDHRVRQCQLCDAYCADVARLEAENARLGEENAQLRADAARARTESPNGTTVTSQFPNPADSQTASSAPELDVAFMPQELQALLTPVEMNGVHVNQWIQPATYGDWLHNSTSFDQPVHALAPASGYTGFQGPQPGIPHEIFAQTTQPGFTGEATYGAPLLDGWMA